MPTTSAPAASNIWDFFNSIPSIYYLLVLLVIPAKTIISWRYHRKPRLTLTVSKYFILERPEQRNLCFELTITNDSKRDLYGTDIKYECETKEQSFFSIPLVYDNFVSLYLKDKYGTPVNTFDKYSKIQCSNKEPYSFYFSTTFEPTMKTIIRIKLKYKDGYGKEQSLIAEKVPPKSLWAVSPDGERDILRKNSNLTTLSYRPSADYQSYKP